MVTNPEPEQNQLLAALPGAVQKRLFPELELVDMELGRVVHESRSIMAHAYFPIDCLLSTLSEAEDGDTTELALVGHDGFVGAPLLLGVESTPNRTIVQSAGRAYQLSREKIKVEFDRHEEAYGILLRHVQLMLIEYAQTVVCNRHHSVDQQLCRWLLLSIDRIPGNTLRMTQQLIANMLGVRREGVTLAAGMLQRAGLIAYGRGIITLKDRPGIEHRCCECYAVIKKERQRLMGHAPGHR